MINFNGNHSKNLLIKKTKGGMSLVHIAMKCIKIGNATVNIHGTITKDKIENATINYLKKVDRIRKRGRKKWELQ